MVNPVGRECRYVILCVDGDPQALSALEATLQSVCDSRLAVEGFASAELALERVDEFHSPDVRVALVITEQVLTGLSGVDFLLALQEKPDFRATRKVLTSADTKASDLSRALNRGALHRSLMKPYSTEELSECVRSLLTSFFTHHAPWEIEELANVLDADQLPRAYKAAKEQRRVLDVQMKTLKRSFLATMDLSNEQVEQATVHAIDEALNSPARVTVPAGEVLLRQDEPVESIFLLLSGQVRLSRGAGEDEVALHMHSAGRIIGLLSLAHRGRSFHTCHAETEISVLPLTLEQLDQAMQADPSLSGYFVTALIRSMATRSMRTAELKMEVDSLARHLRVERDQLADTLAQLEQAQARLVESEKMATLGQMTAGVAHELNNPVAAIRRAADFLSEDFIALLAELPDGKAFQSTVQSALESAPMSTRELRRCSAALAEVVGDDEDTRRLVKVGVTTLEAYRRMFGRAAGRKRTGLLGSLERYHEVGTALRNVRSCATRIAGIVEGLRSYSRSDQEVIGDVDVHEGLEDTLRLMDHTLGDIQVDRNFGDVPRIECRIGQLNQVWTNLVSNAVHAMKGQGSLRIETDTTDTGLARVRIIDSGEGIAPEVLERLFEPHFTTKQGRVEFGLGLGLPICRQIITRHGGTIAAESRPGETCFTVILPVRYPMATSEGSSS